MTSHAVSPGCAEHILGGTTSESAPRLDRPSFSVVSCLALARSHCHAIIFTPDRRLTGHEAPLEQVSATRPPVISRLTLVSCGVRATFIINRRQLTGRWPPGSTAPVHSTGNNLGSCRSINLSLPGQLVSPAWTVSWIHRFVLVDRSVRQSDADDDAPLPARYVAHPHTSVTIGQIIAGPRQRR